MYGVCLFIFYVFSSLGLEIYLQNVRVGLGCIGFSFISVSNIQLCLCVEGLVLDSERFVLLYFFHAGLQDAVGWCVRVRKSNVTSLLYSL